MMTYLKEKRRKREREQREGEREKESKLIVWENHVVIFVSDICIMLIHASLFFFATDCVRGRNKNHAQEKQIDDKGKKLCMLSMKYYFLQARVNEEEYLALTKGFLIPHYSLSIGPVTINTLLKGIDKRN